MTPKLVWDLPLDPDGIDLVLDDGTVVRIRPGRRSDGPVLRAAFERFSEQSRYFRFFSPLPHLPADTEQRLTEVDDVHQIAWGVFDPSRPGEAGDGSGLAIAAARLFVEPDDPGEAEATLAVVDEYQGRGLAKLLIELLVSTAAVHGLHTVRFDTLATNWPIRNLMARIGATGHNVPGDPSVISFRLAVPDAEHVDPTIGALYVLLRRVNDASD